MNLRRKGVCGKGMPGRASALRFGGRRVRRFPSGARSLGRRRTHCAHCVRCVQTVGDSRFTKRAARAAESPVLLSASQARCHPPGHAFAEPSARSQRKNFGSASARPLFDQAGGVFCAAKSRRRAGTPARGSKPGHKQSSGLLLPGARPGPCTGHSRNRAPRRSDPARPMPASYSALKANRNDTL